MCDLPTELGICETEFFPICDKNSEKVRNGDKNGEFSTRPFFFFAVITVYNIMNLVA